MRTGDEDLAVAGGTAAIGVVECIGDPFERIDRRHFGRQSAFTDKIGNLFPHRALLLGAVERSEGS